MTPVDKNHEPIDTILRRAMHAEPGPATPECADAEALAAYSDRSLAAAERERLEMHFADCMRCQLLLGDIARAEESARDARAASEVPWYRRWSIAIPALGAVAAILVFIAMRRPVNQEPRSNEVVAMAKREAPELAAPEQAAAPEMPGVASAPAPVAPAPPPARPVSNEIAMNEAKAPAAAAPPAKAMKESSARGEAHRPAPRMHHAAPIVAPSSPAAVPAPPPVEAGRVVAIAPAAPVVEPGSAPVGQPNVPVSSELPTNQPQPETGQLAESMSYGASEPSGKARAPGDAGMVAAPESGAPAVVGHRSAAVGAGSGAIASAAAGGAAGGEVATIGAAPVRGPSGPELARGFAISRMISSPDHSVTWVIDKSGLVQRYGANGAMHWQHSGVTTDLVAGSAPSATVCWVVGRSGTIIRTTDGEHWELITSPSADNLTGVSASSARDAKITTAGGRSFATSDGGATWRQQ